MHRVLGVDFNPTSPTEVASASDDLTVRIWNANSGSLLQTFYPSTAGVHDRGIEDVHYSLDETRLVSSGKSSTHNGPTIAVWDVIFKSGDTNIATPVLNISTATEVSMASFSPDGGAYILSSSFGASPTQVWNASSGELKMVLQESERAIFSPDGTRICTCHASGEVKVWSFDFSNEEVAETRRNSPLLTIYAAHYNEPRIWGLAYNPNGTFVASGSANFGISGTVDVWNETGGRVVGPFAGEHTAGVQSLSFRPDGRFLVSGAEDWTLKIWDIEAGKNDNDPLVATPTGHTGIIRGVAFSPDGNRIVSGSDDTTVKVWDVSTILPPILPPIPDSQPSGSVAATGMLLSLLLTVFVMICSY